MQNKLIKFIFKYYLAIILLILVISFGQTLLMIPWQDDNALFFKLTHIQERAGFLGSGIFGERAYKYTAFFYYPIYLIFKFQPVYYFGINFILYGVSVYILYRIISKMINNQVGMMTGFLYACGFIGSDSFIRLFNSQITSLSIILVSTFIYTYWVFYKQKKNVWYFISLFIFFLAAEFARARTHYMIAVPVVFELLFLTFNKPIIKSIFFSILRIFPFVPIFYRYVILEDYRSGGVGDLLNSLLKGEIYKIFGFLSSFSNMILPDWFTKNSLNSTNGVFYSWGFALVMLIMCIFVFVKFKRQRLYSLSLLTTSLIWGYLSLNIFIHPALHVTQEQIYLAFIGGQLVLLFIFGFFLIDKSKKLLYIFFLAGIFINLAAYWAYSPTLVYEKINRYLSHSFLYLVILLPLLVYSIKNNKISNIFFVIVFFWGLGNMYGSFLYQRQIYLNRVVPVNSFYKKLDDYLVTIEKGDILFFDVADDARSYFSDAFSVAQMPDSTAIAWRYGIDRYDFEMFQTSSDFFNYLQKNTVDKQKIHTFFYSKAGLIETTNDFILYLDSNKIDDLDIKISDSYPIFDNIIINNQIDKSSINFTKDLSFFSLIPLDLLVQISGYPLSTKEIKFPFSYGLENTMRNNFRDNQDIYLTSRYKKYKEEFKKTKVSVSSDWQDRVVSNLIDGDYNTSWQANRLLWLKDAQFIFIESDNKTLFNKLVFVNSYSDNTPLEFDILGSDNNSDWFLIKAYKSDLRLKNGDMQIVDFIPQSFKFLKINFKKTLNDDSPALSELWLVPSEFDDLNIIQTEKYLENSFKNIPDANFYNQLLKDNDYVGTIELSWWNNKNFGWQTSFDSTAKVIFDGKSRWYKIKVTPGGTKINQLKFLLKDFPAKFKIHAIKVLY